MRASLSALLLAPLLLAGCVSAPPRPRPEAGAPMFDPLSFFVGRLRGEATLRIAFHRPHPVRVDSDGRLLADGALLLRQRVMEAGKPPRDREWRIRRVAPGRYAGTLSDAAGPVAGETVGGALHLTFRMTGGLAAEQWLALDASGRVARNRLTVRKFGLTIAVLNETIRKLD